MNLLLNHIVPNLQQPTEKENGAKKGSTGSPEPEGGWDTKTNDFTESPYCSSATKHLQDEICARDLKEPNLFTQVCYVSTKMNLLLKHMVPNLRQPTEKENGAKKGCTGSPEPEGGWDTKTNDFAESPYCSSAAKHFQDELCAIDLKEPNLFTRVCFGHY